LPDVGTSDDDDDVGMAPALAGGAETLPLADGRPVPGFLPVCAHTRDTCPSGAR
jgi:hypothetical protein